MQIGIDLPSVKFMERTSFRVLSVGSQLWFFLSLFWALIPICNSILFSRVPMVDMTVHDGEHGAFQMLRDPIFIVAFLLRNR